ncbi:hypothetical protein B566_EDAN006651 [Ephemera danica]|nr:hypothetical protein B566_EDAN006651 [Ephemera danica]
MPTRSQEGELFEGVLARVSGWGRVSDSNPDLSPELKFVDLTVVPNLDCENTYGNIIVNSMICLSTAGGTAGSCNGDSGGPLTYQGVQIGIVSFGAAAGCEAGYPLGYTRVTSFLDWLESEGGITIQP